MARTESWFYESAAERELSNYDEQKSSFGAPIQTNKDVISSFDDHFNKIAEQYKESGIDIKKDFSKMSDLTFLEQYKSALLDPVKDEIIALAENTQEGTVDPHFKAMADNLDRIWDVQVKAFNEAASVTGYLPISTLEFPVLVKQYIHTILKDIIEVEVVKTPSISRHVRTTYIVDNNDPTKELEYPRCMFEGTWQEMWDAAKGIAIKEDAVMFDNGRLTNYDIISNLTTGTRGVDQLSFAFKVKGIVVAGETIMLRGNAITVDFSTNGLFLNGKLDFVHEGTHINDTILGQVDFKNGTVSAASTNGQVEGLIFEGYLSNEKNLRSISVREKRHVLRFNIEDGARMNMPFTIEEIEDAAALLDINYYNRMVDEIVRVQEMLENMKVIKFLNDEFKKYNDVVTDPLNLESIGRTYKVDLEAPNYFAGDPFKYMSSAIQFKLKSIIYQLTEDTKLEGLSFVIVGNPMACQLIEEFINWKTTPGTSIGGVNVNSSYGFATGIGANIRVVASNIYDAYTEEPITYTKRDGTTVSKRELVLQIYGYPTDPEHVSCKHLKYTSHLMTSQSQTAYQSPLAPAGAFNIITATSRFQDICIQGIFAQLIMLNSELVYNAAPTKRSGAPWFTTAVPVSSIGG